MTITLCGSMQFAQEMGELKNQLENLGWHVLTPDLSEASKAYLKLPESERRPIKRNFISTHFNKITQADAILVVNYDKKGIKGYIGSNTLMEIGVAAALGKKIIVLHELGPQSCEEEVLTLADQILLGDLEPLDIRTTKRLA